jgi:hypothetical protein
VIENGNSGAKRDLDKLKFLLIIFLEDLVLTSDLVKKSEGGKD